MISIIICSIDAEKYRRVTENYQSLLRDVEHEIIGIHDARSLCEGYNRGIERSSGSLIVFSHDDVEILSQDFAKKLQDYLALYDVIGVAGTTLLTGANWVTAGPPYLHGQVAHWVPAMNRYLIAIYGVTTQVVEGAQALDGLFFAARRSVVEQVRFDAATFDGFHHYDLDFTFSAHLAGFRLAICNDIAIIHHSPGRHDEAWERYRQRFLIKYADPIAHNRQRKQTHDTVVAHSREELQRYWNEYIARTPISAPLLRR